MHYVIKKWPVKFFLLFFNLLVFILTFSYKIRNTVLIYYFIHYINIKSE